MDTSIVFYILETLIVISLFLIIVIKKHDKKVIVFISTLVTLGILFSLFLCAFTTGGDYYSFSSPDRKNSIVVEEWSFLVAEGIRVYERENLFFIRSIGSLPDNYLNGNYLIEWERDKAVVILYEGTENEEKYKFVLKNKK